LQLDKDLALVLQNFFGLRAAPRTTKMLEKFGRYWSLWLNSNEGEACKEIANDLLDGRTLSKSQVISKLGDKMLQAENVVHTLLERGIIEVKKGKIVRSLFIAPEPARHKVLGKRSTGAFVWCAADALALPFMLRRNARITSSCPMCGKEINVSVKEGRIASAKPSTATLLLAMKRENGSVRERVCPYTNFFCSDRHLQSWLMKEQNIIGANLPLDKAVRLFSTVLAQR